MTGTIRNLATSAAAIVIGTVVAVAVTHAQSKDPIKIGVVLSTTGPAAGLGIPERNGAILAAKEINSKGGINGRPIELVV